MSHVLMSLRDSSLTSEGYKPNMVPQTRCQCMLKADLHIACPEKRCSKRMCECRDCR